MKLLVNLTRGLIKYKILPQPDPQGLVTRLYKNYSAIDKSPRSNEAILKTMEKGIDILEKLEISYVIGRGTLLGLHRDKQFLPGDIDIDIDVLGDESVYEIIKKMPFEIVQISISQGRYQQLVFIDADTNVLFDVWFYHLINDQYVNRHLYGYFKFPKAEIEKLTRSAFNGKEYSTVDPDWYCEYWYGKNWKAPCKYQEDWVKFYIRDCSAFDYKPEAYPQYVKLY